MTKAKQIKEFDKRFLRPVDDAVDKNIAKNKASWKNGKEWNKFVKLAVILSTMKEIRYFLSKALDTAEQRGREKAEKELKTRQYKLQMKYHKKGKCNICGKELSSRSTWQCEKHRIMKNKNALRRYHKLKTKKEIDEQPEHEN